FLFGRAAFTLEETAGDAAGGVELFLVIDGEREEILPFARLLRGDRRDQHHGAAHRDHYGAGGLARDLASFDGDGMLAVLKRLGYFCHGSCPLVCAFAFGKRRKPASVRMRRLPASGFDACVSLSDAGRDGRSAPGSARRPCPSGSRAGGGDG